MSSHPIFILELIVLNHKLDDKNSVDVSQMKEHIERLGQYSLDSSKLKNLISDKNKKYKVVKAMVAIY